MPSAPMSRSWRRAPVGPAGPARARLAPARPLEPGAGEVAGIVRAHGAGRVARRVHRGRAGRRALRGRRPGARPSSRTPGTAPSSCWATWTARRCAGRCGPGGRGSGAAAASEYWCKGETSGDRQWVRAVRYDCDGDALLVVVDQDGNGACHTGARSCFYRSFGSRRPGDAAGGTPARGVSASGSRPDRPGRDVFTELCRDHRIVPVWRELVADTLTPVSAFLLVGGGAAPGSCSSRSRAASAGAGTPSSGAIPSPPWWRTGSSVTADGCRSSCPPRCGPAPTRGSSPPSTPCSAPTGRRSVADLPPLHGGLVGYLGYDVVREVEHLPDVPRDDAGLPDAVLHVIGQLCAFDHWRQRVVLVDNVVVGDGRGARPRPPAAFDAAGARLDELAADLFPPAGWAPARGAPCRRRRRPR